MAKVTHGKINGQSVDHNEARLNLITFKGHWADSNGNKIDRISFGSTVRFYIDRFWAYNPKLKISIKSSNVEEIIKEDTINNLNPYYCVQREQYFEIKIKNRHEYKTLQDAKDLELCCELTEGFQWFTHKTDVINLKIEILDTFCDPLTYMQIRCNRASNLFGQVRNEGTKNHQGFDYYAAVGTNIISVADGKVVMVTSAVTGGDYGEQLTIKIDNSQYYAFYAHLSSISVKVGDVVKKGAIIGKTGKTGNASSFSGKDTHLHFECRTVASVGKGLIGRETPNNIVSTKFYSQNITQRNQTTVGVIRIDDKNNKTLQKILL